MDPRGLCLPSCSAPRRLLMMMMVLLLQDENAPAAQVSGGTLTVRDGDPATLTCKMAERVSTLTQISWMRTTRKMPGNAFFYTISEVNGPSFANGGDPRITYVGNFDERDGSLQIANVTLDDEGSYTCIFTLFPSGSFQIQIPLQLLVPPSISLSYNPHVLGNEEVLLATCTAAAARPPAEVSWLLRGNRFRKTANSTSHDNGTTTTVSSLFAVPTREVDGQTVECVVSGPALPRRHAQSFVVQVFFPPTNVTAVARPGHTIECRSEGNPRPSSQWTRPDKVLSQSDVRVDGDNLTFSRWASHLEGLYQCEASNPYGQQKILVYLAVASVSSATPWVLFGLLLSLNAIAAVWYFYKGRYFQRIRENFEAYRSQRVPNQPESEVMGSVG